jgi:CubicO group peptidase (beta-lactamase class C family)
MLGLTGGVSSCQPGSRSGAPVSAIDQARRVVLDAIAARVFPAAVVNVGSSAAALWREALGALTFAPEAVATVETTPFDLASLTKVVATTTVVMDLIDAGVLRLDEPLTGCFPEWRGLDRESVSVQDLLDHSSGLPARLLEAPPATRREFEHEICTMPLEYKPRSRALYSDLGFILLGMLAADRAGRSLAVAFELFREHLASADTTVADEPLSFRLAGAMKRQAAPTRPRDEDKRRGRLLIGDVHDSYAAALGGVAGHAGLFGTAAAVGGFARAILRAAHGDTTPDPLSLSRVLQFVTKSLVPGSSRALGWDTMLTTSSCGTHMSTASFGHVGFTGTSLWIDPLRDRYFVLLTNRACDGGTVEQMRHVRRAFHDTLHDV